MRRRRRHQAKAASATDPAAEPEKDVPADDPPEVSADDPPEIPTPGVAPDLLPGALPDLTDVEVEIRIEVEVEVDPPDVEVDPPAEEHAEDGGLASDSGPVDAGELEPGPDPRLPLLLVVPVVVATGAVVAWLLLAAGHVVSY